jgi:hypothetical protein
VRFLVHRRVEAEQRGDSRSEEAINDLQRTLELVGNLRMTGVPRLRVDSPIVNTVLYPWPVRSPSRGRDDLEIRAVAPPGDAVEGFLESLSRCFTPDGTLVADPPSLRCNEVSIALLIRCGTTRVLLGGDVERANWELVLAAVDAGDLSVQAVKVSHHGSRTGYCTDLWRVFSADRKPVAVITPSLKHRLPTRDAVEHIQRHAEAVYVTCPEAITFQGVRYEFPDRYPIEERAAIRAEMSLFRRARPRPGICSLSFDRSGTPPRITLQGGASQVTV